MRVGFLAMPSPSFSFITMTRPHSDLPAAWPVLRETGTRGDWHEEIYAGMLTASRVGMNGT